MALNNLGFLALFICGDIHYVTDYSPSEDPWENLPLMLEVAETGFLSGNGLVFFLLYTLYHVLVTTQLRTQGN